ncbi:MAG: hypothetical protein LPH21_17670, partial [Shewanella sp.]|nr:hypothetical protein [Shewanella sp.]
ATKADISGRQGVEDISIKKRKFLFAIGYVRCRTVADILFLVFEPAQFVVTASFTNVPTPLI